METVANREYIQREDWAIRKLAKVPRTRSEEVWEAKNPGYELHAVRSWQDLTPGQKVWQGYEGHIPSTFVSFTKLENGWGFEVVEEDEANLFYGIPAQTRRHSTQWDVRFSRVIVKVA